MITVPERFAAQIVRRAGEGGQAWIDALPELAQHYAARWHLTFDHGTPMFGFVGLVLPVRCADGLPAVLKLSLLDSEAATEPIALTAWAGRGAVRLLADDHAHGVLLLERLDHRHCLDHVPITEAVRVAARLLRRLTVPAPGGLPTLRSLAERWSEELPREWRQLGGPLPRRTLDAALAACRELGPDAGGHLVNEDLHYQNVLRGDREPWLVIDPKAVTGDPEFGVIPLLWNRMHDHRTLRARHTEIVAAAELDPRLADGWTLVRAVDNCLWALASGEPSLAGTCAAIAECVLD